MKKDILFTDIKTMNQNKEEKRGKYIRTEETLEKHRLKNAGSGNPFYGKRHGENFKSIRRKMIAEKSPYWKGGDSEYWRKKALKRDDYTCQVCGLKDKEIMEVDHVIPKHLNGADLCLENLQSICPNCHRRKTNKELRKLNKIKCLKI